MPATSKTVPCVSDVVVPEFAHEMAWNVGAIVPPTPHENVNAVLSTEPSVRNQTSMEPEYEVTVPGLADPVALTRRFALTTVEPWYT